MQKCSSYITEKKLCLDLKNESIKNVEEFFAGNSEICTKYVHTFDVHESVNLNTAMKGTNKMQLRRLIYYS
jgi:hypothetical protein